MNTTHRDTEALRHAGVPGDVAESLALFGDRLGLFAGPFSWHAEIGSTNDAAMILAAQGAGEGTVVGADAQTAGRGRRGRQWSSPAGAGLYVSVILTPRHTVADLLTLAAGVALADGIREATGLEVALKWPNDVYVGARKLAGILAEAAASASRISRVVLGFGINLSAAAHAPDIAGRATSLEGELGRPVDRGLVLAACLAALGARYQQLGEGGRAAVLDAWRVRARTTLGRRVEWETGAGTRDGIARDIDDTGALLVDTRSGTERVIAGLVRWL